MPIYKYIQLRINFKPVDYTRLKKQAYQKNLTMAAYCRFILKSKIDLDTKRERRSYKIFQIDKHLLYEINAVGKNLNQIARHVNIKKEIDKKALQKLSNIETILQNIYRGKNYDN